MNIRGVLIGWKGKKLESTKNCEKELEMSQRQSIKYKCRAFLSIVLPY